MRARLLHARQACYISHNTRCSWVLTSSPWAREHIALSTCVSFMQGCLFTPSGECSSALHVSPKVSSEEAANPRMVQGTQEATVELPQRNAALHLKGRTSSMTIMCLLLALSLFLWSISAASSPFGETCIGYRRLPGPPPFSIWGTSCSKAGVSSSCHQDSLSPGYNHMLVRRYTL